MSDVSSNVTDKKATVQLSRIERLATSKKPELSSLGGGTARVAASASRPAAVYISEQLYYNTSNTDCDLSTSGSGGLDTGSVAAKKTYYIYAIPGTGSAFELVGSLTGPDTGPTGFSDWSYIGAVVTNGFAQLLQSRSSNGDTCLETYSEELTHSGDTNVTTKVFDTLPVTATVAYVEMKLSATQAMYSLVSSYSFGNQTLRADLVAAGTVYVKGYAPIIDSQTLYLTLSDATGSAMGVRIMGWKEDPMGWK